MKCRPSSDLDPFSLAGENGKVEYFEDFPVRLVHKFEGESKISLCKCRWNSQELNSWGPHQSLEGKREICRVMLLLHKTSLEGILSRSRVVTAKKCTKECTARVELSLGSLSDNDGDSYKNVTLKVNSPYLKLYRAYSISFNSSNVGTFFWSWILEACTKV